MHTHSVEAWRHEHVFLGNKHERNERRTWAVVALTGAMMVAEIVGGALFGSMALLADGWHMSTHAGALAISALAYRIARRHVHDERFAFGTGKLGELAGYSSALILGMIALLIGYESVMRLLLPVAIRFDEAIAIAVVGLMVNLGSAWLLRAEHGHEHRHRHRHGHEHERDHADHGHHHHQAHDHNLRSAYFHVLADALTSVLAIAALLAGRVLGWAWMDAAVGIIGALVIAHWSVQLVRSSGAVLLDIVPDSSLAARIRERLEQGTDRVADLHFWRLGPGHVGVIVSVVSDRPEAPERYKARLAGLPGLSHVTVEVHACAEHAATAHK